MWKKENWIGFVGTQVSQRTKWWIEWQKSAVAVQLLHPALQGTEREIRRKKLLNKKNSNSGTRFHNTEPCYSHHTPKKDNQVDQYKGNHHSHIGNNGPHRFWWPPIKGGGDLFHRPANFVGRQMRHHFVSEKSAQHPIGVNTVDCSRW